MKCPIFVRDFLKAINGDDQLGFHLSGPATAVGAGNAVTRFIAVLRGNRARVFPWTVAAELVAELCGR